MTTQAAPPWLRELQAELGGLLRQPLVIRSGQLVVDPGGYGERILTEIREHGASRVGRLGVYHRQYWYRLLSIVHEQYPTVTALLGAFVTNLAAARFLSEHPPRGAEIDDAVRGFGGWVAARAGSLLAELPGAPAVPPLALA
ncbi:MAG: putative DNA-binding domain-containing protein, partial [Deltaproteobacteria bacterium]|nr:putative DNA-binding domain-containing protein [Deltaproteobacteria bacterium]